MGMNFPGLQTTIKSRIDFKGYGVHSGKPVSMTFHPAEANTGIVFSIFNEEIGAHTDIAATLSNLGPTELCTVLGNPAGTHIATIEHVMAALRALNVDNVIVEVDSNEVPVMDGSSSVFVESLDQVGLKSLSSTRCYIRVKKPVRFEMGNSWGEFVPYDGTRFEVEIDFDSSAIGRQKFASDITARVFREELCRARTFGFMNDVERLWAAGFALGSSLENSVVIGDDNKIVNPEGLRYENEFVCHKTLDAIGDLALAGAPIIGCFRSYRGGHKLNALTLQALLSDKDAFEFVEATNSRATVSRHDDLVAVGAPAYASVLI